MADGQVGKSAIALLVVAGGTASISVATQYLDADRPSPELLAVLTALAVVTSCAIASGNESPRVVVLEFLAALALSVGGVFAVWAAPGRPALTPLSIVSAFTALSWLLAVAASPSDTSTNIHSFTTRLPHRDRPRMRRPSPFPVTPVAPQTQRSHPSATALAALSSVTVLVLPIASWRVLVAEPDLALVSLQGNRPHAEQHNVGLFGLRPEASWLTWEMGPGTAIQAELEPKNHKAEPVESIEGVLDLHGDCEGSSVAWRLLLNQDLIADGVLDVGDTETLDDVPVATYRGPHLDKIDLAVERTDAGDCSVSLGLTRAGFNTPGFGPLRP